MIRKMNDEIKNNYELVVLHNNDKMEQEKAENFQRFRVQKTYP